MPSPPQSRSPSYLLRNPLSIVLDSDYLEPPAPPTTTTDPPGVHLVFINRAHAQQKVDTIIDAFKQLFPAIQGGLL